MQLAQGRLEAAQVVRQAEAEVEEAAVDGTQLDGHAGREGTRLVGAVSSAPTVALA